MTPNPFPVPPAPPAPPPKRRNLLVIVGLALGVPLALCLLIGGAAYFFEASAKSAPLVPGDREALLTADDLFVAAGTDAKAEATREKTGRRKLFDGSTEVNYEYESDEPPLYVATTISLEKDVGDARTTFHSQAVGGAVGLAVVGQGMKMQDRPDLLDFGEERKSQLLMMDGKPVGNFLVARKGTRVYLVLFTGIYFDEAEDFRAVMEPKLAAFEALER